ncbi:MAG: hypothetical protein WC340_05295 [Kiritimatiellia bacterium]
MSECQVFIRQRRTMGFHDLCLAHPSSSRNPASPASEATPWHGGTTPGKFRPPYTFPLY